MGWIIYGVIALCITLYIWRHTYSSRETIYKNVNHYPYRVKTGYEYSDRVPLPIWLLIITIIGFLTPFLNAVMTIAVFIFYIVNWACDDLYVHFDDKHIFSKIKKWLNKDLFN